MVQSHQMQDPSPMLLGNLDGVDVHAIDEPPLLTLDSHVVSAHLALPHEAVGGKGPVLKPVRPPPLAARVVPFVPELHGDFVVREGKQLLAQPITLLTLPFLRQERLDLISASQERRAVAPNRVRRVG